MFQKKKEVELYLVNTNALLDATGWDIHKLLEVMNVPVEKRESLIQAITKK